MPLNDIPGPDLSDLRAQLMSSVLSISSIPKAASREAVDLALKAYEDALRVFIDVTARASSSAIADLSLQIAIQTFSQVMLQRSDAFYSLIEAQGHPPHDVHMSVEGSNGAS